MALKVGDQAPFCRGTNRTFAGLDADHHHHSTLKSTIWNLLNEPGSSPAVSIVSDSPYDPCCSHCRTLQAQVIAALVMCMILLSTLAFILQTLPQYVMASNPAFDAIEVLCVVVFTIEFVLRLGSTPNFRAFCTSASHSRPTRNWRTCKLPPARRCFELGRLLCDSALLHRADVCKRRRRVICHPAYHPARKRCRLLFERVWLQLDPWVFRPSARRSAYFAFSKRRATFRGFTYLCRRCFSRCSHFLCSSLSSSSQWSCVRILGPVESRACHFRAYHYAHSCYHPLIVVALQSPRPYILQSAGRGTHLRAHGCESTHTIIQVLPAHTSLFRHPCGGVL